MATTIPANSESSVTISITLTGIRALIVNQISEREKAKLPGAGGTGGRPSKKGTELTAQDIMEEAIYRGPNNEPVIPIENMLACITNAGVFFKQGTSKLSTRDSSVIPAAIEFHEDFIPIVSQGGYCLDSRVVTNNVTKGKAVANRPIWHDWSLSFTVDLDTTLISERLFRDVVDSAGKRIGLGCMRPERKKPYGRFVVSNWTVE